MAKKIYVYDGSGEKDALIGTLEAGFIRGEEVFSFAYDPLWLQADTKELLPEPYLYPFSGRQYKDKGELFGVFTDSCPDRWGRLLLQRKEAADAKREQRQPRTLSESDYLLGISDFLRMGSLRYKSDATGPFLSSTDRLAIPPFERIEELEDAALEISSGSNGEHWLKELLSPGSSLGGARPKANVKDKKGDLWIAKFPTKNDDYDISLWEMVAHDLALKISLPFAPAMLKRYSSYGSVFITERFDRKGKKRIPFVSMMALLGKKDGEESSYLEVAEFLRSFSAKSQADLADLWRRIFFNIAIGSNDNHLRNIGMIHDEEGWHLAPVYDANPNPFSLSFALPLTPENDVLSLALLTRLAPYFGLSETQAENEIHSLSAIIGSSWKDIALHYGAKKEEIDRMAPAFRRKD